MVRAAFLLALVLGVTAAGGGCRRRAPTAPPPPKPPMLGTVSVENMSSPAADGARLDVGAMERDLRAALESSGLFATGAVSGGGGDDAGAAPIARARLGVAVEIVDVGTKAEGRARVRLHIDTRPANAPGAVAVDLEGQG